MIIYLVRHGETDWNLKKRVQGREDIALNDNGIKQAISTARAFHDKKIGLIVTSPLIRARETAEIIGKHLPKQVEVISEEGLIERDFGESSGMAYDKKERLESLGEIKGIEPLEDVKLRLMNCLRYYIREYKDQDIIMVSHGGAINAVLSEISNGELGTGKTRLKNACISVIEASNDNFKIIDYNLIADKFIEKGI